MDEKEIYRALILRLSATKLQQHYAPLLDERLEDARVKLADALTAVQRLQNMHDLVVKLSHPQPHMVTERTAELMPLASKAIEVQKQLLAVIELTLVPNEPPPRQLSRKRPRSRSPSVKDEHISRDPTDHFHTDVNPEISLRGTDSRLVRSQHHGTGTYSDPFPPPRTTLTSSSTSRSENNNASSTWADTNASYNAEHQLVAARSRESTQARDDCEVFHEQVRKCTRLVDHAASLRTVLYRRNYLDKLVPVVLNALYFLSDNTRAEFWRDRRVRSGLWDLQECVNSTISLVQDVGTFDQLVRYLALLFIEVCYLVGNFDHFRDFFVGRILVGARLKGIRIADVRQQRTHQIRSMESTEKEWKGMAVHALRNARRVTGRQDAATRERRVEATCLDLTTIFARIDSEPRFADRFLGEDELIYLRKAVEVAVENMTETRVYDAAKARLSTRFLDAMKLAAQRFERLGVQLHR